MNETQKIIHGMNSIEIGGVWLGAIRKISVDQNLLDNYLEYLVLLINSRFNHSHQFGWHYLRCGFREH